MISQLFRDRFGPVDRKQQRTRLAEEAALGTLVNLGDNSTPG
jgi:hypothetical protein